MTKNIKPQLIILVVIFLSSIKSHGNVQIDFEPINHVQGLPTTSIRRILQDSDGYLWLACDNGLVKYDGNQFSLYRKFSTSEVSLTSNIISSLAEGPDCIWVGTHIGLNKINKYDRQITNVKGQPFDLLKIESIENTNDEYIWVGTTNGLFKYYYKQNKTISYTRENSNLINLDIKDIFTDHAGDIWFATYGGGIAKYDSYSDTFIRFPSLGNSNKVMCLYEDHKHNIWMGTADNGLVKYSKNDTTNSKPYTYYTHNTKSDESIESNTVFAVAQDVEGNIWAGTTHGVSVLSSKNGSEFFTNYSYINEKNGQIFDAINAICVTKSGNLWLGSLHNGLLKVKLKKNEVYHNPIKPIADEHKTSMLYGLVEISDDMFIISLKGRGLYILNPIVNQYEPVPLIGINNREGIQAMGLSYFPEDQKIMCGSVGRGLYNINLNDKAIQATMITENSGWLASNSPRGSYKDAENNVWILTYNGFNIIKKDTIIKINSLETIDGKIRCVTADFDKEGNFWIGTDNLGIIKVKLDGNNVSAKLYAPENNKMVSTDVLSVYVDSRNRIWAGTRGAGLSLLNRETDSFEPVNDRFHIGSDVIFNIFENHNHSIMMCYENGLLQINPEKNQSYNFPSFEYFNNTFNPLSGYFKKNDSIFYICGTNGYNKINTRKLMMRSSDANWNIINVKAKGESIFDNPLEYNIKNTPEFNIVLPKRLNDVEFEFANLSFTGNEQSFYAYRLIGIDEAYNYADNTRRFANYINLPKGKYRLELRAVTENNTLSDKYVSVALTISPSLFETWYAFIFYTLFILFIAILIYRTVKNRVQLINALRFTKLQQEKNEELNQAKMKFFTNVSHELLTPLSIIKCSVENMEESLSVDLTRTNVMKMNVNRLTRLVRQILEFRKAESGNLKLKTSFGDLAMFVRSICENNFQPVISEKHIHFSVITSPQNIMGFFDPDKIDKIVYNLLSNAFKYNKENGFVHVTLKSIERESKFYATISVQDSGIGIKSVELNTIFDRFYDGNYRQQRTTGTGIGLSLTKDLVQLHKGTISVESQPNVGSTFVVEIPLDRENYGENEIELRAEFSELNEDSAEKTFDKELKNVLIVDDNHDLQKVIIESLKDKYNVYQAFNGVDAIELVRKYNVELIVSDVMMPRMNGFDLCKEIKTNIEFSHIPVILLTAKSAEEDRIEGYDVGADGYITKPFSIKVLSARIASILNNREIISKRFRETDSIVLNTLTTNSIDREFLTKVVDIINDNIDNQDFNYVEIAGMVNLSKSSLYRKIKSITGMGASDFIRNIRLKTAMKYLKSDPNINVSEVAFMVGYSDPAYFSSCFRKEFGLTPTQVQQENSTHSIQDTEES
jgi:signal transduction histidine kinase/ligand-binding sensor domain-containing protein/DNA-binding response OmpR family regulator